MATSQVAKSQRPFKFVLGGPAHLIHVLALHGCALGLT